MDPASFGQSFSPYTANQPLPLQQQPFPLQGQPTPNFAQNGSQQQQQYQHMAGGKSLPKRQCGCAQVLMCLALLSLCAAIFTGHVTVGRNAHDSLSFASCPICRFSHRAGFASATIHGCSADPTAPVSIRRRIPSEHVAREGEDITTTRNQP